MRGYMSLDVKTMTVRNRTPGMWVGAKSRDRFWEIVGDDGACQLS